MSNDRLEPAAYIRLVVAAALSLGFMARAATYQSPLFDFHSWRQADTATISRNFTRESFNPLYPQIDARGALTNGFVETGFEIHAFAVAALSKVVGFSPQLGRLVNAALFPIAALLLFRFVRTRYGDDVAVVAVCVYALGLPLSLYMDRAFMNESILSLLSLVCLRSAQQYCAGAGRGHLAALVLASAAIAIVKPTYLVVFAPVVGLFWERFGTAALARWELWLPAVASAACGALWFSHAHALAQATGLSFGLGDKLMNADILLSSEYWVKIVRRLFADILGPVGFVAAIAGVVFALQRRRVAEFLGFLAFDVYLLVVVGGNFHHNYYQLPIVPVATVLIALAIVEAASRVAQRRGWRREQMVMLVAGIVWLAVMGAFARSVSAHNWYELDAGRVTLCQDVRPLLSETDRVVFVNERSPDVLFCLDRKGWLLNEHEGNMDYLRRFAAQGGSIVIVRASHPVRAELDAAASRLLASTEYVVYRMKAE